jgi:hypothetical protein
MNKVEGIRLIVKIREKVLYVNDGELLFDYVSIIKEWMKKKRK